MDYDKLLSAASRAENNGDLATAAESYSKLLEVQPDHKGALQGIDRLRAKMRSDWDQRARENAQYYIHSSDPNQTAEQFDNSGKNSVEQTLTGDPVLQRELGDFSKVDIVEIGCGIGRMTKHLGAVFGEVSAIDVSEEMVAKARERLTGLENVSVYLGGGADLKMLEDSHFDLVFSFIVFQHIPIKEAIYSYIRDAYRVLRPGGIFKFQVQGHDSAGWMAQPKDTWHGVTIVDEDVNGLCSELGFGILNQNGQGTQYSWYTLRKL